MGQFDIISGGPKFRGKFMLIKFKSTIAPFYWLVTEKSWPRPHGGGPSLALWMVYSLLW